MPFFKYRAKQGPEKIIEGTIEAFSETAAVEKISQMGYLPLEIIPTVIKKSKGSRTVFGRMSKKKKNREVIFFCRHLASLLKSGVPIFKALRLMLDQEKTADFQMFLESLSEQIREGKTLSQALEKFPNLLSSVHIGIIRAGEMGGVLEEALLRIASHTKRQEELRSKIVKALAYPVLLAVTGIGTIFYIITFVIPKLTKLFSNMGQALPVSTKIVLALSEWMNHYWALLLIVLAVMVILISNISRNHLTAEFYDDLKLKIPFIGRMMFKIEFSRLSRTLEMCLSNGVSFLESLKISIPTMNNVVLAQALQNCCQKVEKGVSFGQSLKQSALFPSLITQLISIGEETGHLEKVLLEIAETYEEDVENSLSLVTTLLEPLMILTVGAIVGFIVMAMLLPIFQMNVMM